MSSNDDFDKFLLRKFRDNKPVIEENGFTEKVLAGLPAKRTFSVSRNHILALISLLSAVIFFVSGGFKLLTVSILNVFHYGSHFTIPAFTSLFVVLVFLCVSFVIGGIVYDESTV